MVRCIGCSYFYSIFLQKRQGERRHNRHGERYSSADRIGSKADRSQRFPSPRARPRLFVQLQYPRVHKGQSRCPGGLAGDQSTDHSQCSAAPLPKSADVSSSGGHLCDLSRRGRNPLNSPSCPLSVLRNSFFYLARMFLNCFFTQYWDWRSILYSLPSVFVIIIVRPHPFIVRNSTVDVFNAAVTPRHVANPSVCLFCEFLSQFFRQPFHYLLNNKTRWRMLEFLDLQSHDFWLQTRRRSNIPSRPVNRCSSGRQNLQKHKICNDGPFTIKTRY